MQRIEQALLEIRTLSEQVKTDYEFMALALSDVAATIKQVEGRMRTQELRFQGMLGAVQSALEATRVDRSEMMRDLDDLKRRVEALERDRPPAA
ncbi:MAG: hypothetical protein AB1758_03730 [Candidatus Eremiobacterota bacterium]